MDHCSAGLDPYAVLGVGQHATLSEIAQARRLLARQYHPDLGGSSAGDERMRRINQAWELLSNPAARGAWDAAHLANARRPAPVAWTEWRATAPAVQPRPPGLHTQNSPVGWWVLAAFVLALVLVLGAAMASTFDGATAGPQPPAYHDNFR